MLTTMLQEQSNHPRHMVLEISSLQIRKEKYLIAASCGVKADVVLEQQFANTEGKIPYSS